MTKRRWLALTFALALFPLAAGCATTSAMTPSATVTTAIQGWEQWFRLDWAAAPQASGHAIEGYVYNEYGAAAMNVQILAQGLDANGAVVNQKIAWVHGAVPPKNRSHFKVAGLSPAPRYRVSVWAFDFIQGAGDAFN